MANVYPFNDADCAGVFSRRDLQAEIRGAALSVELRGIRPGDATDHVAVFEADLTPADLTALAAVIAAHGVPASVDPIEANGVPVQAWFNGGSFYVKNPETGVILELTTKPA